MGVQVVSTDSWEAHLPERWTEVECDTEGATYFEAPDQSAGVYFSAWRVQGKPLLDAMRDTREVELRNLPGERGEWAIVGESEAVSGVETEVVTEYLDREHHYRIVSRLLGRQHYYVRLAFHDYNCTDLAASQERFGPVINSLSLR